MVMTLLRFQDSHGKSGQSHRSSSEGEPALLLEGRFAQQLAYERKRCERSQRSILLLVLETRCLHHPAQIEFPLVRIASILAPALRSTDSIGWHKTNATLGVIITEIASSARQTALDAIFTKIGRLLRKCVPEDQLDQLSLSFHFFPDNWGEKEDGGGSCNPALYPDAVSIQHDRRLTLGMKRSMDILLSSLLLILCSPLLPLIAIAIKSTSHGPILFVQQRVGKCGHFFPFLKFRSMKVNNDCSQHRDFVHSFIAGDRSSLETLQTSATVYKIRDDHRVTTVGRFLRRTSLDELPQLVNVLLGQMSLVGPRPPLPYELAAYQTWHRGRLLNLKPGMTGLWQVKGRSHVRFDDMVRMDLQYAEHWSLWLDLRILLATPKAVLRGAY